MDGTSRTAPNTSPADATNDVRARLDGMHAQLDTIKGEVDALQTGFAEKRQPWYRQASVLIAVAALALSFTTTFYSEQRTREQDVRTARVELSQLIQRLTALPKENFELRQKYSTNPFAVTTLSGSLNSENIVLAKRAAEIIETLPSEKVSAVECYAVAQALTWPGSTTEPSGCSSAASVSPMTQPT